jgi:hypothetical protein
MSCQSFLRLATVFVFTIAAPTGEQLSSDELCAGLLVNVRSLSLEMIFLFALLMAASSKGENPGTLPLEKQIQLPGVAGRIDHFSVAVSG